MPMSSVSDTVAPPPLAPHGIRASVVPTYLADQSDPDAKRFVFRYTVTIANGGDAAARLLSRRWVIIDANGKREVVEGPGVVGKTPRLEAGQSFEYQSFCPLPTKWGTMDGAYHMRRDDGTEFDVDIPRFVLHLD